MLRSKLQRIALGSEAHPLGPQDLAMRATSLLTTLDDPQAAVEDLAERLLAELGPEGADLAVVFASPHHAATLAPLVEALTARGLARRIVGTTGESIVGQDREVEDNPAISLWAARFPAGVQITPLRMELTDEGLTGWTPPQAPADSQEQLVVVLADPFSFPVDDWLGSVNAEARGLRIVGGMASGGHRPGVNRLALDGEVFDDGAVGVLIAGPVRMRTVVSQGCRPVGRPLIVTRAEQNLVRELGRRPALEVFQELFEELEPADQQRLREGLHLGRVISEYQERFERGDFLVRNVLGATEDGALGITDQVRVGQTVQFHVRDAESADEDLRTLISANRPAKSVGALLFTCNGRGTRLFDSPDHDVAVVHELCGPIPVAGFFAMGEIGPVGGQNFLHGFTASIVLFEES